MLLLQGVDTMSKIYDAVRYNKNQLLFIDNQEIRLIDYIAKLRKEKKITKKKISNLVKHNDYWYSQVEQNNTSTNAQQRQKTIYRNDLINIISIIQFDATTAAELKDTFIKSSKHIDNVLKAVPCTPSINGIGLPKINLGRTDPERERLLSSLLDVQMNLIKQTYASLYDEDKDRFLNCLQNMNKCLRIDPTFIISLIGLPYMDFLYESEQQHILELLSELTKQIRTYNQDISNGTVYTTSYYYKNLEKLIEKYIGSDSYDGLALQLERERDNGYL